MEKLKEEITEQELEEKMYNEIKELIENSRRRVLRFANTELVNLYWRIGENIVNNLQKGEKRAKYGEHILENVSIRLSNQFGRGYSLRNIRNMRNFYLLFSIRQIESAELGWSHYVELIKIEDEHIRNFYMQECLNSRWEAKELERMIKSHLYERLLVSNEENKILPVQGNVINTSKDLIKDPYVLEFLNLSNTYKEKNLEKEILNHLKEFLLELGKEKNKTVVKYALPRDREIYASTYLLHLPSKEELMKEIEKY